MCPVLCLLCLPYAARLQTDFTYACHDQFPLLDYEYKRVWRLIHEIHMVFGFIFLMTRCYCTVIDFTYLCFSKYMSSQFDYGGISLSNGSIYFIITDSNYSPMGLRLSLRRRHFVYNVDPRMR